MKFIIAIVTFSLMGSALAACPSKCSGHGSCVLGDKCKCQPRWVSADCSLRECAYGLSWVTSADTNDAAAGSEGLVAVGKTSAVGADKASATLDKTAENMSSTTEHAYKGMNISFLGTGMSAVITTYGTDQVAHFGAVHTIVPAGTPYIITANANNHDVGRHSYTECSSKGSCDRSTGECTCFPGYEGRGCRRQACPNDCSGHGMCRYNHEVNPKYTPHWGDETNELQSQLWDYNKARQCLCDRGYEGYDCSLRTCPKGDDPLTDCDTAGAGGEVSDIQELSFGAAATAGHFTLTFTDMFNGNYTTRPIALSAGDMHANTHALGKQTAADIQSALMDLPNFAVPNVTVSFHQHKTDDTVNNYMVTFNDEANSGRQNLLSCSESTYASLPKLYDNPSAQPRFAEVIMAANARTVVCTATSESLHVFDSSKYRYKENLECSGRGACDSSAGVCQCYEGFTGEACATQTVFF